MTDLFSDADAEKMTDGFIPREMEEKWFIFFEDGWLYFHRSWTGACIYGLRLAGSPAGVRVIDSWVSRDQVHYKGSDVEYEKRLVRYLIDSILLEKPAEFPGKMKLKFEIVKGDLLDQQVDVIVNAWNRNIIPWWLLVPQGVSGAIKRKAGIQPFLELPWRPMPLGSAVLTSAGKLPYKAIIHVAGINLFWRSSERAIQESVKNAVELASAKGFASIAFPIIGSGSGGFPKEKALEIMRRTLGEIYAGIRVVIVDRST